MGTQKDHYELLGVSRDADTDTIKKAYRKLAKKYHPDTNSGNPQAAEMFKKITEAYSVLSDEKKRKEYDQFGSAAFDGSSPFGNGGPQGGYREYHFDGNDEDLNKIFREFFGNDFGGFGSSGSKNSGQGSGSSGFRGFYSQGTGGQGSGGQSFYGYSSQGSGRQGSGSNSGSRRYYSYNGQDFGSGFGGSDYGFFGRGFGSDGSQGYRQDGEDLNADVEVSFEEAAFGCKKVIHFQNASQGSVQSLEVRIPAGISDGKTIRLKGKGMLGYGGGQPGNLLLKIHVKEKPGYERKDMDVYTTVRIPFTTAVFGGEAQIETLYGPVVCKIQPGTQSGTKIRLRGKGIVSMNNPSVHGDQYAVVEIQVPQNLNSEAARKLREFEQALKGSHGRKSAA